MLAFSLRNLLARRRRAALTALAVLVGVAMISGTFIFIDTIDAAFSQLFTASTKGADVIVSSRQNLASPLSAPASLHAGLLDRIRALPGVAAVAGQISDVATIVGRNGQAIASTGSPTFAFSYLPPPFSGFTFVKGGPPRRANQVVIDQATAEHQRYHVGDRVSVLTGEPVRRFRVSGIARLGGASLGGSTFAVFDLATARSLYGKQGKFDTLYVAGARAVAPSTLVNEIGPLLSPELVVRDAHSQVDSAASGISGRLSILTNGLLAFALIAVFVGAFVIFNTFSITVSQRTREFALLRALGASRPQILRSVLAEAVAIGTAASLAGLAFGVLAAAAIRALFTGLGFNLPSTGLAFEPRTVVVGLGVGVLVTVAAGVVPALRATRVAPLEALRKSAAPAARTRLRIWLTALMAGMLALAGLLLIFTSSGSTSAQLAQSAAGAVALLVAVVLVSPVAIRRLTGLVAWPLTRGGRILGLLARENATRNPGRTAVSASALMIGLALVLFVTVYANGLRASTSEIIKQTFLGDFTIESQDGSGPIPAASARAVALVPNVLAISSLKSTTAHLRNAGDVAAEGIDPTTIGQVYRFHWIDGSRATLQDLTLSDVIVERDTARSAHLRVGDATTVTTETGKRMTVTVRGVYADRALLRGFALPQASFDRLFHQQRLQQVFVKLSPGADPVAAQVGLTQALSSLPGVVARSQTALAHEVSGRVDSILVLFYALLAMSVLMSLLGIANTLTLSITERTRELGMLRAVGMTAGQARALIRNESVITAAIGSVAGVALGIFVAWVITRTLSNQGVVFAVPWAQVVGLLALGLLAGVLAALPPALRAGRIDVLAAIAHE
ncbi:MAG: ABC transporter permease [Solirubrobacteraceae bacterium]